MFRKVIIIRHGVYSNETDRLNATGVKQMEDLTPIIQKYLAGEENILLVSSSAERAEDSVNVLAQKLNLEYQTHEYFWSDNRHYQDDDRALGLLKKLAEEKKTDVVVLVTHLEYARDLPELITINAGKQFVRRRQIDKGGMVFLDIENEQYLFN